MNTGLYPVYTFDNRKSILFNLHGIDMHSKLLKLCWALLGLLLSCHSLAQENTHPIADEIASRHASFDRLPERELLKPTLPNASWISSVNKSLHEATFLTIQRKEFNRLEQDRPQELKISLQTPDGQLLQLELFQAEYLTPDFKLRKASAPERTIPFDRGLHYRGIVNSDARSLAMLLVLPGEIAGLVEYRGRQYNLGKIEGETDLHILYPADAATDPPVRTCYAESVPGYKNRIDNSPGNRSSNSDNCVKMYVEADYDIFLDKGGVTPAANYVAGLFSQVSTLYADESIKLVVSEIFVWDIEDPYVGGSNGTLDYLIQFRQERNGDFNGADLGHLVGYQGGGGIAYLNVICNGTYSVGYSDIPGSYNQVPAYSWAVNVVTHEIGHNLGSPHTHDCAWNGNDTPIDNCGPLYDTIYIPSGCYNNGVTPDDGTIMSYCHLIGGVGVSFVENFGQQPGDLIRSRVYNASCLSPCSGVNDAGISAIVAPNVAVCGNSVDPVVTLNNYGYTSLNTVTINYTLDGAPTQTYSWAGDLQTGGITNVTLPGLALNNTSHTLQVSTAGPNGQTDTDTSNDTVSVSFSRGDQTVALSISLDNFPGETSWTVTDDNSNIVASGSGYNTPSSLVTEDICLSDGCFTFTIYDSYGDGICCGYGTGSYTLTDPSSNTVLASGAEFNFEEITNFCMSSGSPCAQQTLLINDNPIPSETYMTAESITSSGTVPDGNTVAFQAGQSITLQAGFHAASGSSFVAYIDNCPPSNLSQADTTLLDEQPGNNPRFTSEATEPNLSMTVAPNPFRNETVIRYTLPEDSPTQLVLFDMLGRTQQVLQPGAIRAAGYQEYRLNSIGLSNGIYLVRLQAGNEVITQKVQVIKN